MANISNINDFFVVDSVGLKAAVGADLGNSHGTPYVGTDFTVVGKDASNPVANLWLSNFTHKSYILVSDNSSNFIIKDSGAGNRLTIDTDGKVGIGTDSPNYKLQVEGTASKIFNVTNTSTYSRMLLTGASGTGGDLIFSEASTGTAQFGIYSSGAQATSTLGIYPNDGSSPAILVKQNGNVGIGTSSPQSNLDIKGSGNTAINTKGNLFVSSGGTAAQAAETGGQISFGSWLNGDLSQPYPLAAIRGVAESSTTNNNRGALIFGTMDSNTAVQERMRIASSGWVSVVTKPNSGLNYDVAIWVGNVLGYQTTLQLSDVLAYSANKLSPYNGITFADGQEATTSGGTVIPAPGRSTSPDPEDYQRSFSTEFKLKSASGNPGVTGSWAGLISMAPYRPSTSGFYATQIAFGGDGTGDGMFTRRGTTTTWGAWREFVIEDTSGNISPNGVYLGGTGSANLLDDYEEGTWTPAVAGVTMNTANGRYIKIGNMVKVYGVIRQSSGTSTSNIITGLPFATSGLSRSPMNFSQINSCSWGSGATMLVSFIYQSQFALYGNANGSALVQTPNNCFSTGSFMEFGGTYIIF